MKHYILLLIIMCGCVSARNIHTTTYHDTTVTTQLTYVETETGYIEERSTHREVTAPRRERSSSRERNGHGKIVTRVISGVVGATALFMSIHYSSKANEYKDLQGVSNFYTNVDMNSEYQDYSNEIQKNETMMGVMLGVSGVSFAVCGVTFFF